ncbi:carbonate dehydratase [Zoogloea sp.]|jgi:carbonic anhydrase|uniref:carbonate dehydratase n=1 Tax=Zoogloea sp. TaxID=49181 RepID=UPI001B44229D|nr:carbonate dehydratase [Zoogloea sp.]MBK7847536.1 carbonate dehydratase [Zoogloea sp.]MBP7444887.1 carbonate dehydratase [Zoogloea sp.]HOY01505.1 carbonate dehydratase [Zoogloea sp.]HPI61125.1 carbonate dehydratase [Zoogloea sp.]
MAVTLRILGDDDHAEIEHVRQFFRNYAGWLGVDLGYQNFAEEMASLPGAYSPPTGRLFFAELDGRPAGCIGIRAATEGVCEMKRLYVEPESRGSGVGRELALAAIKAAKSLGYRKVMLDTLPAMRIAVKLYRELGFKEAPAYYPTPIEGTMFLALDLENWSESEIKNENLFHLFDYNLAWSRKMRQVDPGFFEKLSTLQNPEYLWIGCSDSRVPANEIIGLLPGEVFVHRNVANVVVHTDLNCLSVIQFAVDVLKVKHIMVVGHYGCGGVKAALKRERVGLVDLWLRHVQDVHVKHLDRVELLPPEMRHDRLCELNALEQVVNVCQTIVVQDAWKRGQPLTVHGWVYGLKDGLIRDLGINVSRREDLMPRYFSALETLEA